MNPEEKKITVIAGEFQLYSPEIAEIIADNPYMPKPGETEPEFFQRVHQRIASMTPGYVIPEYLPPEERDDTGWGYFLPPLLQDAAAPSDKNVKKTKR